MTELSPAFEGESSGPGVSCVTLDNTAFASSAFSPMCVLPISGSLLPLIVKLHISRRVRHENGE